MSGASYIPMTIENAHDDAWCPMDLEIVAYTYPTDYGSRIHVSLNGPDTERIAYAQDQLLYDNQPAWSRDCGKIAFIRNSTGSDLGDVVVLDVFSDALRRVFIFQFTLSFESIQ